jgi:hypothetical protein
VVAGFVTCCFLKLFFLSVDEVEGSGEGFSGSLAVLTDWNQLFLVQCKGVNYFFLVFDPF